MTRSLPSRQGSSPINRCKKDSQSFSLMNVANHCVDEEGEAEGPHVAPLS